MDTRRTDDQPLRAEQAARLLGVSERTVRRWIASGKLSGTAHPWATTRAAVEAWREHQSRSTRVALEQESEPMDTVPDAVPDKTLRGGRAPARMGVYAITHTPTGHTYIGSSLDIDARIRDHRASLVRGHHQNRRLQEAWTADGPAGFAWSVRDYAESEEELPVLEQQWISCVRPYYNNRQTAGRARTRPALRYVARPAAPHPQGAGAAETTARLLTDHVRSLTDDVVRLAREAGRLEFELAYQKREVSRLEAELAQLRGQRVPHAQCGESERRRNGHKGQAAGALSRLVPWLRG